MTFPVFIVGSGRSGTYSMFKSLNILPNTKVHHEYKCEQIQKLGCCYWMGNLSDSMTRSNLEKFYIPSIVHSKADVWIDCSNKISWLIDPLEGMLPDSHFVWLLRDPRKSALSFYHKLIGESYDYEGVELLINWIDAWLGVDEFCIPPEEKPYFWPVPKTVSGRSEFLRWTRWRRICWYFNEVCREIEVRLPDRSLTVSLEDLVGDFGQFDLMLDFIRPPGVGWSVSDREAAWQVLRYPANVIEPVNYQMTEEQEAVYREICGDAHERLGYDWGPLEAVQYDN